jgi:hypothetical protein
MNGTVGLVNILVGVQIISDPNVTLFNLNICATYFRKLA